MVVTWMIGDGVSRTGATATSLLSLASHPQVPAFPFYQWCNPCTTMAMEACDETHTRGEKNNSAAAVRASRA